MVHQHFSLVNKMTVLDNVILGLESRDFLLTGKVQKKAWRIWQNVMDCRWIQMLRFMNYL